MVRYPHSAILKSPGTTTWQEGKAIIGAATTETIECDVQPDGSNFQTEQEGKTIVSQYSVFLPLGYTSIATATTLVYAGREYNIIQKYENQLDIQLKIG